MSLSIPLSTTCLFLLSSLCLADAPLVCPTESHQVGKENQSELALARLLIQNSAELWLLLSGIQKQEMAEAQAQLFIESVQRLEKLHTQLEFRFNAKPDGFNSEEFESIIQYISELNMAIDEEFLSLWRVDCYGSPALKFAFDRALNEGYFELPDGLSTARTQEQLSAEESHRELIRMQRLLDPDAAVVESLSRVTDANSAALAAAEIKVHTTRLQQLAPTQHEHSLRPLACHDSEAYKAAYAPLEKLLWALRNELVRIAALPQYDDAPYDDFSNALDQLFLNIASTHSRWYGEIFDDSFFIDLDDAAQSASSASDSPNN